MKKETIGATIFGIIGAIIGFLTRSLIEKSKKNKAIAEKHKKEMQQLDNILERQEYQIEKAKYECAIAKERFEKTNSELAKDYVENFDKRVEEILSDPNGQLDFNDL